MRSLLCLPTIALTLSLLGGAALAEDRGTPGGPRTPEPREPASVLPLLTPGGGPAGPAGRIQLPSAPEADDPAAKDSAVDAALGISVPLPPPSGPQSFSAGQVHAAILEDGGCTWTNDNVAACLILECDPDGVCVEAGTYCVDHNGNQVPCP